MIEKKDWEDAKKSAEETIKNSEINMIIGTNLLKLSERHLKKFSDKEDPMPETVKEIVKGAKKK